jgi:hypothetical protein
MGQHGVANNKMADMNGVERAEEETNLAHGYMGLNSRSPLRIALHGKRDCIVAINSICNG